MTRGNGRQITPLDCVMRDPMEIFMGMMGSLVDKLVGPRSLRGLRCTSNVNFIFLPGAKAFSPGNEVSTPPHVSLTQAKDTTDPTIPLSLFCQSFLVVAKVFVGHGHPILLLFKKHV